METVNASYLSLAIIIFSSIFISAISRKIKQPPVIGLLLLGIVLGPTLTKAVNTSEVLEWIAHVGVLFLLFEAGLETDIKRLKQDSKQALLPALGGVILPIIFGIGYALVLGKSIFYGLIIGSISTATSVSVSVITLIDLNKLKGVEGRCIVNAAIVDDILGILLVTVLFSLAPNTAHQHSGIGTLVISLAKIIGFFAIITAGGMFIIKWIFKDLKKLYLDQAIIALAMGFIFIYAWLAEEAGVAAITGAYFAGLFLGQTKVKHTISTEITTVGKSFFVSVFFVNIGLEFNLFAIDADVFYILIFILIAIAGKFLGSTLGALATKFDGLRSTRIGIGMLPRGEVALIIANMALKANMLGSKDLSATILMVIATTIITPFLLKIAFDKKPKQTF